MKDPLSVYSIIFCDQASQKPWCDPKDTIKLSSSFTLKSPATLTKAVVQLLGFMEILPFLSKVMENK